MQAIAVARVFTLVQPRRETMREVNLRIRAAAMRLDGLAAEIDWDFLCECGEPTCMEFVGLPMRDFEALVAVDGLVLARGHRATCRVAQLSCEPA